MGIGRPTQPSAIKHQVHEVELLLRAHTRGFNMVEACFHYTYESFPVHIGK
jgi:hypothetical protein